MTIVEFLEARLAEDERIAKATGEDTTYGFTWPNTQYEVRSSELIHIRRHDPERALREVAAKRAILAQEEAARSQFEHVKSSTTYPAIEVLIGQVAALATVIRHLASIYSSHPDYQQEWAL